MSLPEISRRCLSCGAAVRAGSRFCHQCGKVLPGEAEGGAAEGARPPDDGTARADEWTPPTKEFAAFVQSPGVPLPAPAEPTPAAHVVEEVGSEAAAAGAPGPPEEEAREGDEAVRAGEPRGRVARVREGTRARVGRMREEAIVVLEETPDDPGLRFVIAAAALFVLFVVLLFLSTTVLR